MFRTIKPYLILAVLVGLWALHSYDKMTAIVEAEYQISLELNAQYQEKLNEAAENARETERLLRKSHEQQKQLKDAQIKNINSKLDTALAELLKRPSRPTDNSPNPPHPSSCTGAELYREDGEFLAREAARAERVLKERDFYYQEYENVRRSLSGD